MLGSRYSLPDDLERRFHLVDEDRSGVPHRADPDTVADVNEAAIAVDGPNSDSASVLPVVASAQRTDSM